MSPARRRVPSRARLRSIRAAVVVAAALTAAACGKGDEPRADGQSSSARRQKLQDVSPPAMAGAEAPLQERIGSRYASLISMRGRDGVSDDDLAAAYGGVGKLLMAAELLNQAEPYLRNARALAPRELAWPYYLGQIHRLRNERDQAIALFEEALQLQPDYVPALVWLGALHLDRGDPAAATPWLQKAVSLQPGSAAARFALGRAALAAGDHATAREHLEAALAADPRATRVHYTLAMTYRALGDARQADAHLARWQRGFSPAESLEDGQISPADPLMEEIGGILQTAVGYERRATAALDERRWADAIAAFRDGLKVAPADATLHQNLGTALYLSGDEERGRAEFEEAIRLSPGYARAHFSLGLVMETRGSDEEAMQHYSSALQSDPGLVDARFRLADTLRRSGRAEASLPHYEAIIAADPRASQARFAQAMALVRLGRHGEARSVLEAAAALYPEQPGFAHALARVLAAAPDDGVRDGRRALTITEGLQKTFGATAALLETGAMALAETGRFSEAAARQREAMAAAKAQGRPDLAGLMTENLRRYESRTPCRTPWRSDDPVHVPARPSGLGF